MHDTVQHVDYLGGLNCGHAGMALESTRLHATRKDSPDRCDLLHHVGRRVQVDESLVNPAWNNCE